MAKFEFIALDGAGKERRGMVEAPNRELASTQIKSYGLMPAKISPVSVRSKSSKRASRKSAEEDRTGYAGPIVKKPIYFGPAIGQKALALFTRQLSTLIQNGLSLIRSLETLLAQERNPSFKWVLSQLIQNIHSGNTFSEGLAKFPKEFDTLYLNMVRAGEASGTLDTALIRLSHYMQKARAIRSKIAGEATYPIVVMIFSFIIVMGLMQFVVPRFAAVYEKQSSGTELPKITQIVTGVSNFIVEHTAVVFGGLGGLFVAFLIFKGSHIGQVVFAFLRLRLPLIKDAFSKLYISRFCRTFGTLMESGVSILEALNLARDAVGNPFVMSSIDKIRNRVKDGEPLARPMAATGFFPPMVSNMVEVGEETGELPEMLTQIAEIYDDEVDASVSRLTSIAGPLMIFLLAIVILIIALSLFLPFMKIYQDVINK